MTRLSRRQLSGTGRAWIYKVNASNPEYASAWGDWDEFLRPGNEGRWGGSWATGNARSLRNFDDLRKGDRVWAYQTASPRPGRGRRILGITEVVRVVPSQEFPDKTDLYLKTIARFDPGLKIHEEKKNDPVLSQASALKPGNVGTLYDLEPREHKRIVDLALSL